MILAVAEVTFTITKDRITQLNTITSIRMVLQFFLDK